MAFLNSLGYLAGGLATGMQQGGRMRRENEREKREQEEFGFRRQEQERLAGARRAAGNTLGNVGQQREDGSTYDAPGAYQDYAGQVAQFDPAASMQARTSGLQLAGLQRQEAHSTLADQTLALMRRVQAGENPVQVFQEGAKLYSQIPDGRHASVSEDGQNLVLTHAESGTSKVVPATSEIVMKALQRMLDMSSPGAYEKGQERGLKERQVGAAEQTAGAAVKRANTDSEELGARRGLYSAQAGMYGAHSRYYDRMGSAAVTNANRNQEQIQIFIDRKTGEAVPFRFNRATGGFEKVTVPEGMSLGLPNQRGLGGTPEALGGTGLIKIGDKLFRVDERSGQLVPVQVPGASILDRLGAAEETHDSGGDAWQRMYQMENSGYTPAPGEADTPFQQWYRGGREANQRIGNFSGISSAGYSPEYGLRNRRRDNSRYQDIQ